MKDTDIFIFDCIRCRGIGRGKVIGIETFGDRQQICAKFKRPKTSKPIIEDVPFLVYFYLHSDNSWRSEYGILRFVSREAF